ncbi:MAG: hypothetical protein AAF561_00675 [Planctomycetota bacterium]
MTTNTTARRLFRRLALPAVAVVALPGLANAQEQKNASAAPVAAVDAEEIARLPALDAAGVIAQNDIYKFGEDATGSFDLVPAEVGEGSLSTIEARGGVLVQVRGVGNFFEDASGDDDIDVGFEQSRVNPYIFGTLGPAEGVGFLSGPIEYRVQGTFVPDGGDFTLEDAFVVLPLSEDIAIRGGQFLNPVSAERTTFGGFNLAVDRSLASDVLGAGGYVQGVTAVLTPQGVQNIRGEVGITDGLGSGNTSFRDTPANIGAAGRFEFLIEGDWAALKDFSAIGTTEQTIAAGAGADLTFAGDTTLLTGTGDFRFENADGIAAYGAVFVNLGQFNGDSTFNIGGVGQASFLLEDGLEPFGRVSALILDDDTLPISEDFFLELTTGLNYYFEPESLPHTLKLTVDGGILPFGTPGAPQLDFISSEEFQLFIRGQLQILL